MPKNQVRRIALRKEAACGNSFSGDDAEQKQGIAGNYKGLPENHPNNETIKAIEKAEREIGLRGPFDFVEEMIADILKEQQLKRAFYGYLFNWLLCKRISMCPLTCTRGNSFLYIRR